MRTLLIFQSLVTLIVLMVSSAVASPGQDALQRARDLYAQAAYEDALGVLSTLDGGDAAPEAGRYRAACLLALGRVDEAREVVGGVVRANPEYVPDPADTSPRVTELFKDARRATLPDVLRAAYVEAKAAMDGQDLEGAIRQFELVVRLAADAEIAADSTIRDLNVLAGGFLELARARLEAAKPAPADSPEPVTTADPSETLAPTPGISPAQQPSTPLPLITPAVPIEQALPPWVAPDAVSRSWEFTGAVRVEITADGRVTSATMEKPVHPSYDARLLAAAKGWTYQPARLNGVPVSSSLTVRVVLKPR